MTNNKLLLMRFISIILLCLSYDKETSSWIAHSCIFGGRSIEGRCVCFGFDFKYHRHFSEITYCTFKTVYILSLDLLIKHFIYFGSYLCCYCYGMASPMNSAYVVIIIIDNYLLLHYPKARS